MQSNQDFEMRQGRQRPPIQSVRVPVRFDKLCCFILIKKQKQIDKKENEMEYHQGEIDHIFDGSRLHKCCLSGGTLQVVQSHHWSTRQKHQVCCIFKSKTNIALSWHTNISHSRATPGLLRKINLQMRKSQSMSQVFGLFHLHCLCQHRPFGSSCSSWIRFLSKP